MVIIPTKPVQYGSKPLYLDEPPTLDEIVATARCYIEIDANVTQGDSRKNSKEYN